MIYEQVLACVDLDALHDLEQSLTMLVGDVDGVSPDHAADLVKAMLDRALLGRPLQRSRRGAGGDRSSGAHRLAGDGGGGSPGEAKH